MTEAEARHAALVHRALLSIAIVLYRSDPMLLARTLRSLVAALARLRAGGETGGFRLVLVDNGTGPHRAPGPERLLDAVAMAEFDEVRVLPARRNLGFGRANNLAIDAGLGEFHLVLNPDVELDPDALLQGFALLRAEAQAVAVVPEGRDAGGAPLYLAKRHPTPVVLLARALRLPALDRRLRYQLAHYEARDLRATGVPEPVPLASGCCMLLRGAAFAAVGGFSPAYFLYFEDFDLSLRLAAQGKIFYHPAMRIVHHGGSAARKGAWHQLMFLRSMLRFFCAWGWHGGA